MKHTIIGLLLLLIASPALATRPQDPPDPVSTAEADADAHARADSDAYAGAHAGAEGGDSDAHATGGRSDATGGAADATGGSSDATGGDSSGASSTTSYESTFFAISRSQPGASGCWGGVDGGGASDGGGGFLGIHLLNKNCWASYMAELERSVRLRAALNCGGKEYRNAIAYEFKKKDRQKECNRIVTAEYLKQIENDDAAAQNLLLLQEIDRLETTLMETTTDRDTVLTKLTNCRTAEDRATKAYMECLAK